MAELLLIGMVVAFAGPTLFLLICSWLELRQQEKLLQRLLSVTPSPMELMLQTALRDRYLSQPSKPEPNVSEPSSAEDR